MNKAVFLDRDGTINVDHGYVYKPEDLQFINQVPECLLQLLNAEFLLIIITNQSGVGRGFFSEKAVDDFNKILTSKLLEKGVRITDVFVCPHSPDQNCDCRKPSPKLILEAIEKYDIDPTRSFMIGDKDSDVLSGENAGLISFILDKDQDFSIITDRILKLNDEQIIPPTK